MEENQYACSENCPHYNKIKEAKQKETTREDILKLSNMFKLFADDTRLRIICILIKEELCVCDLCEALNLNQSTVSHQLQLLRNSNLVKYRRDGKQIFYSLQDEHVERIISQALEHILEEGTKNV